MAIIADCVERMIQFRQQCPGAEFDLKPNMFTARVPGHDEPFRSMSLCKLMDALERWAAGQATRPAAVPDRTSRAPAPRPMTVCLCSCGFATDDPAWLGRHQYQHPGNACSALRTRRFTVCGDGHLRR